MLRDHRERFAFGALVSAFLAIGLLNRINPDAFIVGTNVARLATGRSFDPNYVTSLSADGVPALLEALPAMDDARRRAMEKQLLANGSVPANEDWRTWNWSREQASRAVMRYQLRRSSDLRAAR